jgi:hypothetical protein
VSCYNLTIIGGAKSSWPESVSIAAVAGNWIQVTTTFVASAGKFNYQIIPVSKATEVIQSCVENVNSVDKTTQSSMALFRANVTGLATFKLQVSAPKSFITITSVSIIVSLVNETAFSGKLFQVFFLKICSLFFVCGKQAKGKQYFHWKWFGDAKC